MPGLDTRLRNLGPGPDQLAPTGVAADFAVVVCHRDYYCSNCRQQARRLRGRYDEFRDRDAEIVAVMPENEADARDWHAKYDLPHPVLADPETVVGDALDQPVRFGILGQVHDVVGRMPTLAILDLRGGRPRTVYVHRGSSWMDRPGVDELLSALDRATANPPPQTGSDDSAEPAAEDVDGDEPATGAEVDDEPAQ